jgi:hypothetical protein
MLAEECYREAVAAAPDDASVLKEVRDGEHERHRQSQSRSQTQKQGRRSASERVGEGVHAAAMCEL